MLSITWVALLLFPAIALSNQSCDLDGICTDSCEDQTSECESWANEGLCRTNREYMIRVCPKACNSCGTGSREEDFGIEQTIDIQHEDEINQAIDDMKAYFRNVRQDSRTTTRQHELFDNCKLKHELCSFWKVIGECDKNPDYMKKECAPVCLSCEYLSIEHRCPIDPEAPIAWKPGDLNRFFWNITTLPQFQKYQPNIISRPDLVEGDSEESADYKLGPWVVTLDNFVSDEEADRLIQLGAEEGYKRSSDVGKMKFDGTYEENVNDGRTSLNAWCQNECYRDPAAMSVISRIENLTNVPEIHSEYLQLLKYEVGQYYRQHHDYIDTDVNRQQGVRLLTVFLYLNDVEEGGGTRFPLLDITVMPKKGRVLIWPSVMNDHPDRKDRRTEHEALPVEKGIKYGANAWIHQRDFKTPNKNGCQ